jgi:alpha-beta hydrolase superfamily lysophospholipase
MAHSPIIQRYAFRRRPPALPDGLDRLSPESQAALRQFTPERLVAYGLAREDAEELLGRVVQGDRWWAASCELGERLPASGLGLAPATAAAVLFRKAALMRASQLMMIEDTPQRRDLYTRAAQLYADAGAIAGDRARWVLRGAAGMTLVGWRFAVAQPIAAAIVWGGIEGWAMDFAAMGEMLAARGIIAYLIDGPGQGETRLAQGLYFAPDWQAHWRAVVDQVEAETRGLPLFMVGNSMGGCMTMNYAPHDSRIRAVCSNGGPLRPPPLIGDLPSKLRKFVVFCGDADAGAVWGALDSAREMARSSQPLLILHGGADPLVTEAEVLEIAARAAAEDVRVVVYSDGDHCIYNHPADKHDLIAEWIRAAAHRQPGHPSCWR